MEKCTSLENENEKERERRADIWIETRAGRMRKERRTKRGVKKHRRRWKRGREEKDKRERLARLTLEFDSAPCQHLPSLRRSFIRRK